MPSPGAEPPGALVGVDEVERRERPERHDRVQHRRGVHVHEVERACAVAAARAADGHVEVLRVAGGRGDRHGHARERRGRRVVQVAGDDRADVAALDDLGEARLVAQLDRDREIEHARHGRVVHREDRAVRRRDRELLGEPVELLGRDLAVVVPGHGRVEGDDAQAVDVVDPIDGPVPAEPSSSRPRRNAARSSWLPMTQMTCAPRRSATGSTMRRMRSYASGSPRSARSPVKTIASGLPPDASNSSKSCAQVPLTRDPVVQHASAREEVRVADVEDEVVRPGILGRTAAHGRSPRSSATHGGGRQDHASRPRALNGA